MEMVVEQPAQPPAPPSPPPERTDLRVSARRGFGLAFKWFNALLVLFNMFFFVTRACSAGYVYASKVFPLSIVSVDSLLVIGSLTAVLGFRRRANPLRRLMAKSANLAALIAGSVWLVQFGVNNGFATTPLSAIVAWAALSLCVPFVNAVVFWRSPAAVVVPDVATSPAAAQPQVERETYWSEHWRGQLPLGVSFWVNGWLGFATILALQKLLDEGTAVRSPRTAAVFYGLINLVALVLGAWVCVGCWRSAMRHVQLGRKPLWAALARLIVVLLVMNQIGPAIWIYYPKVREHLNFVSGQDSVEPYQIQVSPNGEVIEWRGGLRFGSASALESALEDLPKAKILKINSPGGRVSEGMKMMALVHKRGLDTYASERCMSAATLVLCAGRARGAEQGTRIGFHSSRNPAGNSRSGDATVLGSLVSAGVSEAFVRKVMTVHSDDMWFPTVEEMLEAGVLTSYAVFPPTMPSPVE
jgi:hypothetical protein